ncbi:hypothetical protein ABYF34_04000 [Buchananella felis]|uniref:GAP1-N2 domain-containing protein n=1 Tax=Buchananella felis TaxID=3231492 RepID=UPI0035284887
MYQLTYASLDHEVAGVRHSGWHVIEKSAEMPPQVEELLVGLIRSQMEPLNPLPGFPATEQLAKAEIRFYQFATAAGTVLIHTAESGYDSLGRPSTFTHAILLDEAETGAPLGVAAPELGRVAAQSLQLAAAPGGWAGAAVGGTSAAAVKPTEAPALAHWRSINAWRAPFWRRPFGADAARATALPNEAEVRATPEVGRAYAQRWLSHPSRMQMTASIAAALDQERQLAGAGKERRTVVVGVESCDEAAGWLCALAYLATPAASRAINYSSWERARSSSQAEGLRKSGLDLAFVPRADLPTAQASPAVVAIDAHVLTSAAQGQPGAAHAQGGTGTQSSAGGTTTAGEAGGSWGALIAAALNAPAPQLPGAVQRVLDAVHAVEKVGAGCLAEPLGWALAVAEAGSPGTVAQESGGLAATIDALLLRSPAQMLENEAVRALLAARFSGAQTRDATHWNRVLQATGPVELTPITAAAVTSYLRAVVAGAGVEQALAQPSGVRAHLGAQWAALPPSQAEVDRLLPQAAKQLQQKLVAGGLPANLAQTVAGLRAVDWLAVEGCLLPHHPRVAGVLNTAVRALKDPQDGQNVITHLDGLSTPMVAALAASLSNALAAVDKPQFPQLQPAVVEWLRAAHPTLTAPLRLELAALDCVASQQPSARVEILGLLKRAPQGWSLSRELDLAIAASLSPAELTTPQEWRVEAGPSTALAAAWNRPVGAAQDWFEAIENAAAHTLLPEPRVQGLLQLRAALREIERDPIRLCPCEGGLQLAAFIINQTVELANATPDKEEAIHAHMAAGVEEAVRLYVFQAYATWQDQSPLYLPGDDYARRVLAALLAEKRLNPTPATGAPAPEGSPPIGAMRANSLVPAAVAATVLFEAPARNSKFAGTGAEEWLALPLAEVGAFDLRSAVRQDHRFAAAASEAVDATLRQCLPMCEENEVDWLAVQAKTIAAGAGGLSVDLDARVDKTITALRNGPARKLFRFLGRG